MLILIITKVDIIKIKLGILLSDLGRKEEALIAYNDAIEIDPMDGDTYYNRGRYYFIKIRDFIT